jgi:DNA-binding CsgD family transcriptional regulator
MSIWQRFLDLIGLRPKSGPRYYHQTEEFRTNLTKLAEHQGRSEDEVFPELLTAGLIYFETQDIYWEQWLSLTEREKEVAALACLGLTNPEIAHRLGVSSETIKSHMSHVLTKMEIPTRHVLQQKLGDWDFSEWNR